IISRRVILLLYYNSLHRIMLKRIVDKSNITSRKYFIEHCTVAGVNIAEESSMCSLRGVEHHRIIMQHDEHRQHQNNVYTKKIIVLFHSSSVVEQSAVNRSVAGSNPACGAILWRRSSAGESVRFIPVRS